METTTTNDDDDHQQDLISALPDDVVIHIIDHLDFEEAARTTTLSKRWRPLFRRIPYLSFYGDIHSYDTMQSILRARNGYPIKECIAIFEGRGRSREKKIETIVSNICDHVVEILSLSNAPTLPSHLFSRDSLVHLSLINCGIVSRSPVVLPRLKFLHLYDVHVEDGWIEEIIPLCVRLEVLIFGGRRTKVDNLVLRTKSLLTVRFVNSRMPKVSFKEATSLREVEIAPDLRYGVYDGRGESNLLRGLLSQLNTVKSLNISCTKVSSEVLTKFSEILLKEVTLLKIKKLVVTIDLSEVSANSFLSCLLHRCPKLEVLWVENCSYGVAVSPQNLQSFWETQKPASCLFYLRNLSLRSLKEDNNFSLSRLRNLEVKSLKEDSSFSAFANFLGQYANVSCRLTVCYKERSEIHLRTFGRCSCDNHEM